MKKLIYADTFSIGAFHEVFNSSSLLMFSEIFEHITYYSTKSSYKAVNQIIGSYPKHIKHKRLYLLSFNSSLGNFIHHIFSSVWNIFILLKASNNDVIFYNFNSLWTMSIMNKIAKLLNRNVIIMCHGEFDHLSKGVKLNRLSTMALSLFQSQHFDAAPNLYFCVLGESILRNIKEIVSEDIFDKFISFEHTFISRNVENKADNTKNSHIKIGAIGVVRALKGLDNILSLAEILKSSTNIEFYVLGRIYCDSKILDEANIRFIPNAEKDFIDGDILNDFISQMDYIVFLYPQDGYKFTASGALLDAINHEKRILSLHNDYFDTIFQRINCGVLFNSVEDMADYVINNSSNGDQAVNFEENKEKFSPKYEASSFKSTLKKIYDIE